MARIDDLPADQQAVLRLLLTQDRSYDEIARSLRMAPAAVRDRAHEALSALGPSDTPLSASRRAELTDWLLGQQGAADAQRTEEAVADSPAALAWARVVSGELKPVAEPGRLPDVPSAGGSASALVDDEDGATPAAERSRARTDARAGRAPSSRRGGAILLGVLALLAVGLIGFFVGRATKDEGTAKTASQQATTDILGQANLRPPSGSSAPKALGIAQFIERDDQPIINVLAQGLPRAPEGSGYGVWLTGKGQKPLWLGYFQQITTNGQAGAQSVLKVPPDKFAQVLITRQQGRTPTQPGTTFLAGPIRLRDAG